MENDYGYRYSDEEENAVAICLGGLIAISIFLGYIAML